MLPLEVYVFSQQGAHTAMKTNGQRGPAFENASVAVFSEFFIQNNFKDPQWDDPASKTT